MALSKGVKIGLVVFVILLAIVLVWYFFKSPSITWKETPHGDISGSNYDIETRSSGTLDEDKAYALQIGAKSFLRNPATGGGNTIYKNATGPVSTAVTGPWSLFVKQ